VSSPLKGNHRFGGTCRLHLHGRRISQARNQRECRWQAELCWFLAWLIFRPRRWRRHVPPKRRLTFNELHGVISQKIVLLVHSSSYIHSLFPLISVLAYYCPPVCFLSSEWSISNRFLHMFSPLLFTIRQVSKSLSPGVIQLQDSEELDIVCVYKSTCTNSRSVYVTIQMSHVTLKWLKDLLPSNKIIERNRFQVPKNTCVKRKYFTKISCDTSRSYVTLRRKEATRNT
jgi:hypothetical protein